MIPGILNESGFCVSRAHLTEQDIGKIYGLDIIVRKACRGCNNKPIDKTKVSKTIYFQTIYNDSTYKFLHIRKIIAQTEDDTLHKEGIQLDNLVFFKVKAVWKNYRRRFISFMLIAFRRLENGYINFTRRQKTLLKELVDDMKQLNSLPKINDVHNELSDFVHHLLDVAEVDNVNYDGNYNNVDEEVETAKTSCPVRALIKIIFHIENRFLKHERRVRSIIYPNILIEWISRRQLYLV